MFKKNQGKTFSLLLTYLKLDLRNKMYAWRALNVQCTVHTVYMLVLMTSTPQTTNCECKKL
jgi:hypothetical protein